MTDDPNRPGRRLKFTLVPRNEADDPSILDIVRRAIEDAHHAPLPSPQPASSPTPEPPPPVPRGALREDLEDVARQAVEEALAKVPVPTDPKFDPAEWAEQLSKVWAAVRKAKAAGIDVRVTPDDAPPAEGA